MQIVICLDEEGADPQLLERSSSAVRADLLMLDVDEVSRLIDGDAPPGTRGMTAAAFGALVVSIRGTVDLVTGVVSTVRSWIGRGNTARTAEITIGDKTLRLTGVSTEQQDRLIEQFVLAVTQG